MLDRRLDEGGVSEFSKVTVLVVGQCAVSYWEGTDYSPVDLPKSPFLKDHSWVGGNVTLF